MGFTAANRELIIRSLGNELDIGSKLGNFDHRRRFWNSEILAFNLLP